MKTKYLLSTLVLISLLFVSGIASARPLNAALGTGFTYQGKLTDGGAPADGAYDFEFKLYDALSGGSQVGSTVPLGDVAVADGLFTVQLDFGNVFDGTALFLEIGVRPGASIGAYTPLTPRQALTATPYANYAAKAPWSGLTGVPAGLNDGDDNTTYTAGDGLELVGAQFKGKGTPYQNVVIVAKSGGDFTTITAALASILDASASNHYLVYVAPGMYTESVTMKQYVDIEGAGELTTKITYTGSAAASTGTLLGANDAELRFLTVENTGDAMYAVAIYNSSAAPRLTHVTASASGGTNHNYGVFNSFSSPTMTNVTASASGGTFSFGVYNAYSSATINNSVISASGGTNNYGIYNFATSNAYMVRVNNSQITGNTTIRNDSEFTTRIGASQLSGGAVVGGGTVTCAGVYDESYTFSAGPVCP